MLTVVTGAAGFVGRGVVREMRVRNWPGKVRLVDNLPPSRSEDYEVLICDIAESDARAAALAGATHVLHLAALPGGASEADPAASCRVNLDATLGLIELLAGSCTRLVHASSIAVLGSGLTGPVDDDTPVNPQSVYGRHKAACEAGMTDAVERGLVNGLSLRLPGIVARPRSAHGFGSAFLSDLFHAVHAGESFAMPTRPQATSWLLSQRRCAANLLDALMASDGAAVATMPALHVRMDALAHEIGRQCGRSPRIEWHPEPTIESVFASYPPLTTARAERLGLSSDGSLAGRVDNVRAILAV